MNTKQKPRLVASYDTGMETERGYSEGKDTGQKWIRKENISKEKKEASYKKQKEASNKGNTHINNLYNST